MKFIGSFRGISRKDELRIRLKEPCPIREVVKMIIRQLPELERALIDPECGTMKSNTLVLVNGKEIGVMNRLETVIEDGDEVVLVPVVHGG